LAVLERSYDRATFPSLRAVARETDSPAVIEAIRDVLQDAGLSSPERESNPVIGSRLSAVFRAPAQTTDNREPTTFLDSRF
jgi:hypothetical protein